MLQLPPWIPFVIGTLVIVFGAASEGGVSIKGEPPTTSAEVDPR